MLVDRQAASGIAILLLLVAISVYASLHLSAIVPSVELRDEDLSPHTVAVGYRNDPVEIGNHIASLARGQPVPRKPYKAVLCSLMKNEGRYLEEWIIYHFLIGFDHFILQDHGSTDGSRDLMEPYIQSGLVEWRDIDSNKTLLEVESSAHWDCVEGKIVGPQEAEWMATFDLDEQLVSTFRVTSRTPFRPTPLHHFLDHRQNENVSVISLSRYTYLANNRTEPPPFPLTQADYFTERRISGKGGSGIKPIGYLGRHHPEVGWAHHWVEPNEGWLRVDAGGEPVHSMETARQVDEPLFLAHFVSRSYEDCVARSATSTQKGTWRYRDPIKFCQQFMPPDTDNLWVTDNYVLQMSPYNVATRILKATGGLFTGERGR